VKQLVVRTTTTDGRTGRAGRNETGRRQDNKNMLQDHPDRELGERRSTVAHAGDYGVIVVS
jgi:hypothetical protein